MENHPAYTWLRHQRVIRNDIVLYTACTHITQYQQKPAPMQLSPAALTCTHWLHAVRCLAATPHADSCSEVYLATLPPVVTGALCSFTHLAALSATALSKPFLSPSM